MKYQKKLVLFTLFAMNLVDQPTPPVVIEQGTLTGIINNDGTIFEYIGIPYSTVDSTNRFKAPHPPPKWKGVFKATEETSCIQNFPGLGSFGSENCLTVNVYVPAKAKHPLPVMVWIHGGAFSLGSGGKLLYEPKFIVKHDVILVTFNYRLGILGFLCLGTEDAPGNAGIKDQIAALRWVKKNIEAFGGDPDNVTIFGESAGATSISLLYASPATNGLFERAIIQSGSSLMNMALNRKPVGIASLLAKSLGYDTEDPHEIYKIFSKMTPHKLVEVEAKKPFDLFYDIHFLHLPCIERPIPGVESVINDLPYDILTKKPKNLPIIYGSTTKEGYFFTAEETNETLEERNVRYIFASDLAFPSEKEAVETDKILKEFFFGKERISMKTRSNVTDMYTQLYFEHPTIMEAEIAVKNDIVIYNYVFNYSGGRNFLKHRFGFQNETGACHGDELMYLFNGKIWPYPIKAKDQQMIDWMTEMWTNFAKYGDPTPSSSDLPIKWERSTKEQLKFLYFDEQLHMGPMPNPKGYRLWNDIYKKYRRRDL